VKVLVVTNMYPTPAEPWFGCFVREQVEDLQRLGVEIEVLAFDGRRRRSAYFSAARRLPRRLGEEPFDLVHAHYGLTGALVAAQRRVPVVTSFYGSDTVVPWQRAISWLVARSTTPIFVSREAARRLGYTRALIVPTAVDLDLFQPLERREARRALRWPEEGRYVLLPGARRNPVKGAALFDRVVERAWRTVPDLEPVSLEGFSRRQVALVMSAVDVTLMTSLWEGSPVAVKESLASLTPVVSVAVGDVPELLAGLPGCTVAARDADALAAGVLRAVEAPRDPSLRERVQPFSRPRIAERILAAYRTTLEGSAALS
jgi:teichuronic acid biosynthesis glycosyltransferase TuaC